LRFLKRSPPENDEGEKVAKRTKKTGKAGSARPQLIIAVFCERSLTDADRVYTIIRIVDVLNITVVKKPAHGDFIGLPLTSLIGFKSNGFKGKLTLALSQVGPSGVRMNMGEHTLEFLGNITGAYAHSPLIGAKYEGDGDYHFEVRLDGRLYTRMPLRLNFQIESVQSQSKKNQSK
jgi:hypothetical protein